MIPKAEAKESKYGSERVAELNTDDDSNANFRLNGGESVSVMEAVKLYKASGQESVVSNANTK